MLPFAESYLKVLEELHAEIEHALDGLPPAALDWSPGADINSIAVLTVHVAGSLRYWIGDIIAGSPSNRDRPGEFRTSGLDAAVLKNRLAEAIAFVRSVVEQLTLDDLETSRTVPRDGTEHSVAWCLGHALAHTGTHVGHIQLTRQWWEQQNS